MSGARSPVRAVLALAGALPVLVYVWVAVHRLGYPFELDWMEGGSVELAARVAHGQSLYVAPSLRFVGWTYTPLYYWAAAALGQLAGVGFATLRAISFAASLAAIATLAWIVTRETGERAAGIAAGGLFAATFQISGAWFDTGRVDSLFLALTLAAVAYGRRAEGASGGVALGVLAFLAFFTKQTALVALVPMLAWLALTRRRVGVAALVTLAVLVLGSTAALDARTGGWYRYYVFGELAGQPWAPGEWAGFWTRDVLGQLWPLAVLVAVAAAVSRRRWPATAAGYYGVAAAGLIAAAWVSRLHTGGYANVLMPAYAACALAGGLACAACLRAGAVRAGAVRAGAVRAGAVRALRALPGAAVVLQLALLAYPVGAQLPTSADRAAGAELLARLRSLHGNVVVLRHPWYAIEARRGAFAHGEAISEVLRSASARGRRALRASLGGALDADRVDAVVLDGTFDAGALGPELARDFRLAPGTFTSSALYPLTDVRTAPMLLYVRVRAEPEKNQVIRPHRTNVLRP